MTAQFGSGPSQKQQQAEQPADSERTNLTYQHGTIGIQAVAAAARYAATLREVRAAGGIVEAVDVSKNTYRVYIRYKTAEPQQP